MPIDALTMAAVQDDIRALAGGGRIQKIIQPSLHAVGLNVYKDGHQHWILLSADARYARAHILEGSLAKAFPTPSAFVMLLRKHMEGARLIGCDQPPHERILLLTVPMGCLAVEVMGRHSNIIFIGENDQILGAVKMVPPRESRVRPILPGRPYYPPPVRDRDSTIFPDGPRIDPHLDRETFETCLQRGEADASIRDALLGLLPGSGPFLADQIAVRAGYRSSSRLRDADPAALVEAAGSLYALYETRAWQPTLFTDTRGRPDFAPFSPVGVESPQPVATVSLAIERSIQGEEHRDVLSTVRKAVLAEVERELRVAERRAASLAQGLEATSEAEEVMQQGQLILAYQYTLEPGMSELAIPELSMTIPLDHALSGQENAERAFRRYRKLRQARERIPGLLQSAEAEVARLRDIETFVRLAETESDLRRLQRDVRPGTGQETSGKKRAETRRGPPQYRLNGYTAIVGRSARENEEVTFRLARRNDLWLHARERTGAHVVLRDAGDNPPDDIVRAASALAAYYSEGRNDTAVDVDVTAVRNVRKIPGGPPGRVTYAHFRTMRVEPGIGEWKPGDRP